MARGVTQQDIDDRQTVAAVLAGDRQRFALLVRKYHRPLLHLASNRLRRQDVAEDAVQDAFICAFRSLATYKSQYSFRTWLWTIALNQCRRHGTRLAKAPVQSGTEGASSREPTVADEATPDLLAMVTEQKELLAGLLARLPEVQSDAIRLRFYGQLKYREIADAMGSSLGAAKQRVRVGLVSLGEMLRDDKLMDSLFPEDRT